jgi:hypothetical protein
MDRSERMHTNREYQRWAGEKPYLTNWRSITDEVFQIIKKCAEEECDGDYEAAWEKCYTRFIWS